MREKMVPKILHGDSLEVLKGLDDDSIDFICTDPPYGYGFMNRDWDRAVPSVELWQECLRVLKPGAFINVMSAPRSDVLSRMIVNIGAAGFRVDFTPIYWTYASGFPKAGNIGKLVDKRNGQDFNPELKKYLIDAKERSGKTLKEINVALGYSDKGGNFASDLFSFKKGNRFLYPTVEQWATLKQLLDLDDRFDALIEREEAEREKVGEQRKWGNRDSFVDGGGYKCGEGTYSEKIIDITAPATDAAKALDGSYAGFQPKPAVEVVIVAMKPLSEKTYVDQALKNGKGITWLDDGRIPTGENLNGGAYSSGKQNDGEWGTMHQFTGQEFEQPQGRFPANLLVQDDVLNDGVERKSGKMQAGAANHSHWQENSWDSPETYGDSGSFSRYFDLDKWASTLPFLIVPKASKSEKNKGLDSLDVKQSKGGGGGVGDYLEDVNSASGKYGSEKAPAKNHHPTCKPLRLMSYLITLFSRPGDTVLDPFVGSGTTIVAAKQLGREGIGIEREKEYAEIAQARLEAVKEPEPTLL